ncbi:MAG TPA: hypothetical protein VH187_13625 [Scandinavium sp.]|jgi:hypothetical protein|uniref:hypothetical protein n=1 Tax=Scandinavium sp. TaxID=2830653 RepID=UPI002E351745|nr:hypothetical protein [Scandinavium sp.]HEX4502171.1 hypothetical protein [Scandinavium sp.]
MTVNWPSDDVIAEMTKQTLANTYVGRHRDTKRYLSMRDRVPNGNPINDGIAHMQQERKTARLRYKGRH